MPETREDQLRWALFFSLGYLRVRGMKRLLTDDDRRKIANDVVDQLKQRGWRDALAEVVPAPFPGVTGPSR